MKLSYLRHILETKGLLHGAERLAQVVSRFSQGRRNFSRMISCLEKEFLKEETNITFCVSASVLKRHEDLIRALQDLGHEIAAHGYYHTRMTNYSKLSSRVRTYGPASSLFSGKTVLIRMSAASFPCIVLSPSQKLFHFPALEEKYWRFRLARLTTRCSTNDVGFGMSIP